jgi:hypothetical protein
LAFGCGYGCESTTLGRNACWVGYIQTGWLIQNLPFANAAAGYRGGVFAQLFEALFLGSGVAFNIFQVCAVGDERQARVVRCQFAQQRFQRQVFQATGICVILDLNLDGVAPGFSNSSDTHEIKTPSF